MTDWESLVPRVRSLQCEDEVAGLAVSSQYIVCQFWVQPEISVFCRRSLAKLRELQGHEYGGQSVAAQAPQQTPRNQPANQTWLCGDCYFRLSVYCKGRQDCGLIFSASQDRTLRSWDGETGRQLDTAEDHTDYIQVETVTLF